MKAENKQPVELVRRTGPEIFKFEAPGDSLRGRLLSIDNTDINGKPALKYVLHDEEEDKLYSFLGTVDLNSKIKRSDVGKIVQIDYKGQDSDTQNGKNPIKRFEVYGEK